MKLENLNILLISNEAWRGTWFSKHHYANELSKKNKVFFVDPPPPWRFAHLFTRAIQLTELQPSLSLISYTNVLPFTVRIPFLNKLNSGFISRRIKTMLAAKGISKPLVWSFDPFRLLVPAQLEASLSVYHCMDDYRCSTEAILAANSDHCITVSEHLQKKLKPYAKNTLLLPHGVPGDIISANYTASSDTCLLGGSIDSRIDFQLLEQLIEKYPQVHFKIAGKICPAETSVDDSVLIGKLKLRKNIEFTGHLPFAGFMNEIKAAKICLCLYRQDKEANRLSSLKVMQYLAAGKPVVSTWLEEYNKEEFRAHISLAKTPEEFLRNFEEQLNGDTQVKAEARSAVAAAYTYDKLLARAEAGINTKP